MGLGRVLAAALLAGNLAALPLTGAAAQEPGVAATDESAATAADTALQALYEEYWDWRSEEFGLIEEANGSMALGAGLPSVTPEAQTRRAAYYQDLLARLSGIDMAALSPAERTNAIVFRTILEEQVGDARYREWEMPFDSDSSFWTYLNPRAPYASAEEYERYIARMRQVPRYFAEHIENARAGLARGFSVPRVTLEGRDASIESYTGAEVEQNPFWDAFEAMPQSIAEAERDRLRAEGRAAIEEAVIPAYRDLLSFMREEYLPATRTSLGAREFPDGEAYYRQQLKQYTTLDLGPEEIHEIGLREVARIEREMQAVMDEVGFEGTLPEFTAALRSDPQFIAEDGDELMGVSAYVAKRVDGVLDDYFGFLPRHRFTIRPVPEAIAPFYTAGRGGLESCLMNTHDLPSRPLYNIPALTLHECVPGHSFQASVALEREGAPRFRRQTYFSGFGEGWGLYTEYLGEEMGIYRTPYERFGKLSYEMWRAVRLVIDTGIHHYGWDRQRAVDYLADRTALSEHEVGTEVDRYISWPGQATAYKLGEMTIRRLRREAEAELGEEFDIRKFHDVILALGSVPLPALETRIEDFIASGGEGLPNVTYE
ncbi:DUF885 domain-containing protein [Pacificimonas flava]|uniref:DUF885 domain-containing protein n=2 Tax=Pacificimonas TaxID=1960290 RepID=A0A219B0L9_9SPHN|nr:MULTISPECIES: DUF885 family protein [Pacificimonas]MBZ6379661.1 DUF885 family protein [Pacificimonas aurantium]OWV31875.1 DUF885 domain-containing protein [Pacificimonas flava]